MRLIPAHLPDRAPAGPGLPGPEPRILAALWRRRLLAVTLVVLCVGGAAAGTLLRPERWRGELHVAIGNLPPVGLLDNPADLANRLSSHAQVRELTGLTRLVDADSVSLSGEAHPDGRTVVFVVAGRSSETVEQIMKAVATAVLTRHRQWFDRLWAENEAEMARFEALRGRLEQDLETRPAPAAAPRSEEVLALALTTAGDDARWTQLVNVSKHAGALRERNLEPRARTTELVYGPEIEAAAPRVGLGLAIGLALIAGLLIALFAVAVLEWAAVQRRAGAARS